MKLPLFKANKTVSLTVPCLDGGMNLTDASWLTQGDTLTDCRDMWFQKGLLRTRAGFWTSSAWEGEQELRDNVKYVRDCNGWFVGIILSETDGEATLTVTARGPSGGEAAELLATSVPLGTTYACVPSAGTAEKDTLLLYVSDGRIWALQPSLWTALEVTSHVYVPTVTTDGCPVEGRSSTDSRNAAYQQRNRLTDRVRSCYTPDGVGMYYYLPYRNIQGDLHVCVSGVAGSVWEYHVAEGESVSETVQSKVLVLERATGMFYFQDKEGENTVIPVYESPNSVVAEYHVPIENPLVYDMTFGVWYGGDKSSAGGHRLFLSGNSHVPHAVIWSVAENPFYFPENSYRTVGLSDKAITAFGKQESSLVMFKENEMYAAEYIRGGSSVTDTTEATFPVYAIHTEIGCDCPKTVALVGGRLTWACRDGNVYQLKAPSAYGSRGVISVGEPIRPLLQENDGTVSGQVWDGHYYLLYGWTLWVMTDAEKHTWYRFLWPENGTQPCGLCEGSSLQIFAKAGKKTFWFSLKGTRDVYPLEEYRQLPVHGMFCTKLYNFGTGEYKRVKRVMIQSRSAVTPRYHTEFGSYRDGLHRPDAGGVVECTPNLPRCRLWALQLEGEGLTVGSIGATAKTEGSKG